MEIRAAFNHVARHRVNITQSEAIVALSILKRTQHVPPQRLERIIGTLQTMFGSYLYVTESKLQDVVIACIMTRLIDPFPGRPAAVSAPFRRMCRFWPTIKRLDCLQEHHRVFTGQTLVKHKKTGGGFFTVIICLGVLLFTTVQVMRFLYSNTIETRSILPSMVAPLQPFSSMVVSVDIAAEPGVCIAPNSRAGTCLAENVITALGIGYAAGAVVEQSCTEALIPSDSGRLNCSMTWSCNACTVVGNNGSIEFYFGDSRTYSTTTTVRMRTSTGIDNKDSTAWHQFSVGSPRLLRRGFPTTEVQANLLKTSVVDDTSILFEDAAQTAGYHVQFEPELLADGNQVTARTFALFTGLPIYVRLLEQPMTLSITRSLQEKPLDVFSALLGGISGMAAACITVMRLTEFASARRKVTSRMAQFEHSVERTGGMVRARNASDARRAFAYRRKSKPMNNSDGTDGPEGQDALQVELLSVNTAFSEAHISGNATHSPEGLAPRLAREGMDDGREATGREPNDFSSDAVITMTATTVVAHAPTPPPPSSSIPYSAPSYASLGCDDAPSMTTFTQDVDIVYDPLDVDRTNRQQYADWAFQLEVIDSLRDFV
jgi:hypothetical protein